MAPITKHNSKKERECDYCVYTRIRFLIFGNTAIISHQLCPPIHLGQKLVTHPMKGIYENSCYVEVSNSSFLHISNLKYITFSKKKIQKDKCKSKVRRKICIGSSQHRPKIFGGKLNGKINDI